MTNKKVALIALGLCSVLAVTSCGGNEESSKKPSTPQSSSEAVRELNYKGTSLDIMINYKKSSSLSYGVSYTGSSAYNNPFDGATYQNGSLLPTWKQFGTNLEMTIRDAADYSVHTDDDQYNKIYEAPNSGVAFKTDGGQFVDLWMNSEKNMNAVAANGGLVNLADHLDAMPNLKAFLNANPAIKSQLTDDYGKIYIAPYFDGFNNIEKMIMMDTNMVKKLLDEEVTYDTAVTIDTTAYTAFLPKFTNEKISVVGVDGELDYITVTQSENIITTQNALSVKNGQTLTTALKTYLQETYGKYVGAGKLYENYSDIFISANACYNVDELVALMRCVRTNPQCLTGTDTVIVMGPRETSNASRINNIIQLASIWGIQGLTAEKDYLYFNAKGELMDARTNEETYTVGLANLHKLHQEGLILEEFASSTGTTKIAATYIPNGQLFMEYDYNATSAQYNAQDEVGIGKAGGKTTGFRPVVAPVTNWKEDDHSVVKYTRHTEDNRALKSGGWVIPAATDNLDGALKLMDYLYSPEGADLQDFGPAAYRDGDKTVTMADGTVAPKINPAVLKDISTGQYSDLGWNNWYRCFIGSTQGVGHVRNNALDYQVTSAYGQIGLDNVNTAIAAGAMTLATTNGEGFNKSVPTSWSITAKESTTITESSDYTNMVAFWKAAVSYDKNMFGAVKNGLTENELSTLKSYFTGLDNVYLETYRLYVL